MKSLVRTLGQQTREDMLALGGWATDLGTKMKPGQKVENAFTTTEIMNVIKRNSPRKVA